MTFNPGQLNELRKIAQNPTQSQYVQALVDIIVELEHQQLEAVEALHDAQGIDGLEITSTREERRDALLDLGDAVANGELKRYWFEHVVAQEIENWEDALPYAGLSEDAWRDQQQSWASMYRREAPEHFEGLDDREIVARHVNEKFGVSLDAFEREVIGYSRQDALKTALASNFQAVETGIQAAAAHARNENRETEDADA